MLWQRAKDQVDVEKLCGPKTLRSGLVGDGGGIGKVDVDDLEPCELLGQGAYGTVHKVQEKTTGQCRVMKTVVRPEGWDHKKLKLEAELLRNLDHPHILRIFSWYEDGDSINIVMEHCEGGELVKVVRQGRRQGLDISEKWLSTAIRQTFEALVYLHSKGVVHKDLKGQNLLLLHNTESDSGQIFNSMPHVVVCDLGIAEVCCRGIFGMRGTRVAGTPATMAPEVWKGSCGPKSDVWSMGCVIFELFTNKLPFEVHSNGKATSQQQEKWLELHRRGPDWKLLQCSPRALALCKMLLTLKEAARPSASECLRHPWFECSEYVRLSPKEVESLCQAVLTWRKRNPMQRAMCLKMAVGSTCISKFASIFTKFDTDHSGILDRSEMVAALQHLGIERSMAKKAASALDVNGDNSCEYLEFVAACLSSLEGQFDELLRQEFRQLDKRGQGELTSREFGPLLAELRPLADAHGLQLEDIDQNSDGVISFSEFCEYFGRPGVKYVADTVQSTIARKRPSALPMKEHIRIMNTATSFEESREQMRKSMERADHASGARRQQSLQPCLSEGSQRSAPGAAPRAEAGRAARRRPDRALSKESVGRSEREEEASKEPGEAVRVARRRPRRTSTEEEALSGPKGEVEAQKGPPRRVKRKGRQRRPQEVPPPPPLPPELPPPDTGAPGASEQQPDAERDEHGGCEEAAADPTVPAAEDGAILPDERIVDTDDAEDVLPPLPHPCSFKLSSDNVLVTASTSFAHSPVTSFERIDASQCAGCLPYAVLSWSQQHAAECHMNGPPRRDGPVDAYSGQQVPLGHCIVSL